MKVSAVVLTAFVGLSVVPACRTSSPTRHGVPSQSPLAGPTAVVYQYSRSYGGVTTAGLVSFPGYVDGVFQPPSYLSFTGLDVCEFPITVGAFGDFNGDGLLDAAFTCGSTSTNLGNYLSVVLANGDGTFGPATHYPIAGDSQAIIMVVGDFNNDGILDLLTTSFDPNSTTEVTLLVYPGDGSGGFGSPISSQLNIGFLMVGQTLVADFNGDGNLDLLANIDPSTFYIVLGRGDGTFDATPRFQDRPAQDFDGPILADLNGDGIPDLVIFLEEGIGHPEQIAVQLGNGDGTFGPAKITSVSGLSAILTPIGAGDLDGDGKQDLVVGGDGPGQAASGVYWLPGNGDGTFGAAQLAVPSGGGIFGDKGGALVDLDGDGKLDIVVPVVVGFTNGGIAVSLGQGSGTFGPPQTHPASFSGGCCNYVGPLGHAALAPADR